MLVAFVGCSEGGSGDAIVQGTVTIDGQLAESGSVLFHSTGDAPAAYGAIRKNGSFALRVGRGNTNNVNASKIQSGEYVATVQIHGPSIPDEEFPGAPPKTGPLLIAEKYTTKATSGLTHTFKSGRNVVNLELESPSEEELATRAAAAAVKEPEAEDEAASEAEASEEPESEAPSEPEQQTEEALEEESPS